MTAIRSAFLAAAESAGQLVEVAQGTLDLLPKGTIVQLFPPRVEFVNPYCIHFEHVLNEEGFILETKQCRYKAEAGFLCRLHDSKVLTPHKAGKVRDFDNERVTGVIKGEAKALFGTERERVNGITYVKDLYMKSDPEKVVKEVIKVEGLRFDIPIFPPDFPTRSKE